MVGVNGRVRMYCEVIGVVMILLWGQTVGQLVKIPVNTTVTAVYVLGDSIMDTGNNNNNFTVGSGPRL